MRDLQEQWVAAGHVPPFGKHDLKLWAVWFVDDALCFFRSLSQAATLLPQLLDALRCAGLSIDIHKCALLSLSTVRGLPVGLRGLPQVDHVKFLGAVLSLSGTDEPLVSSLLSRTSAAFMQNRPLLVSAASSIPQKLALHHALVMSTVRWLIGCVSPSADLLRQVRVHGVTMMILILGLTCHQEWCDVRMLTEVRHIAKCWCRAWYGCLLDAYVLSQGWAWLGHALRHQHAPLLRMVVACEDSFMACQREGGRRARTGPDNSSWRRHARWLAAQGLDMQEVAQDRVAWRGLAEGWLTHWAVERSAAGTNILQVDEQCQSWSRRCLLGVAARSKPVFACIGGRCYTLAYHHRVRGWVEHESEWPCPGAGTLLGRLKDLVATELKVVHVRLFLHFHVEIELEWPTAFRPLWSGEMHVVVEWSRLPASWLYLMPEAFARARV